MPWEPLRALMVADVIAIHLGLACILGALASRRWLGAATSAWAGQVARGALMARRVGVVLGLAGVLAAAWLEAAAAADAPLAEAGPAVVTLLQQTHAGHAWAIGLVAWLVMGAVWLPAPKEASRVGREIVAWLALAVFVATRSAVSHAANRGDASLAVLVDGLHLVLACLWVGIVFNGARIALPPAAAPAPERADAIFWVARMSATATWTLAVVVATGAFQVWRGLGPSTSLHALVASDFGRTLLAKLALVALAVLLGGVNRWRVLPPLFESLAATRSTRGANWRGRLVAVLRVEALTLMLVLVAAAVLAGTELP